MKKMLLALVALFTVGFVADSSANWRNRGAGCNTCATPVVTSCAPACGEIKVMPRCFKTVEVPAKEVRIAQAPRKIVTPQPDLVRFEAVPDVITYECPADCN